METLQSSGNVQTRCPNCQTVFEIGNEIIGGGDPRVRCGECYTIFDSHENLLISSLSDDLLIEQEDSEDNSIMGFEPGAELDLQNDKLFFEPDETEDEIQSFSDVDLFSDHTDLPEVEYLTDGEEIPELDFNSIDSEDDQFDGTLFDDVSLEDDEPLEDVIASKSQWETPVQDDAPVNSEKALLEVTEPQEQVWNEVSPSEVPEADNVQQEQADDYHEVFTGPPDKEPSIYTDPQPRVEKSRWLSRSIMVLVLITGLGGLYAYLNRNQTQVPAAVQPAVDVFCRIFPCKAESAAHPDMLHVVRRHVYSHPKVEQALVINIVFRNDASAAQPYPVLAISMSDRRGDPVAQRDFLPYEYLKLTPVSEIPKIRSGQIVDISLEVSDPGENAKSFELEFK